MSQTPASDPNPASSPRKRRGLFAFFFKSALGCTAFGIGALIVLVLLLPSLAGGFAADTARKTFDAQYRGSLALERVELAWFGEQKIDGLVVRDPDGRDVVRASAVLPSLLDLLRSGQTRFGKVRFAIDADLVQDDAGVTNLQRALAERHPATKSGTSATSEGGSALERLADLELDLEVTSKRLTWSDRETRRVGIPFEVRDLLATVKARPRAPVVVHATGKVVSEQPGALAVDATLAGPIDPRRDWPFGKVDLDVRIEGFSTAMVDGIAGQGGNLVEVLGKRFSLSAVARGATLEGGDVEIALDGERAGIALAAQLADGLLRSRGEKGLVASFPAPRGYLKQYVDTNLPSGTQLVLDAGIEPWTVRAPSFAVPLPRTGERDLASLVPTLEQSALDLRIEIPSRFAFENDVTRAGGVQLAAKAIQLSVRTAPGEALVARLESKLESGREGALQVDASARDAWKKLAAGALPHLDLDVRATNVATAAVGALCGQRERAVSALGAELAVNVRAENASLEAGNVRATVTGADGSTQRFALELAARVADGRAHVDGENRLTLRLSPSEEWLAREIAAVAPIGTDLSVTAGADAIRVEATNVLVPLSDSKGGDWWTALRKEASAEISARVAGASYADATLKAAGTRVTTSGIELSARLAPGGGAKLDLRSDFAQGSASGKLEVDVSTTDAFEFASASKAPPPVDARVLVQNLPSALVDAFVQHEGVVERALGSPLSVAFDAKNASLDGGTLVLEVGAPNARVRLGGRVDGGVFRASGEDLLQVEARVPEAVLREELAALLPADTRLAWPNGAADLTLDAREIAVPLPRSGAPFDLGSVLDGSAARLGVTLQGIGFENTQTRDLHIEPFARDVSLQANLAPGAPLGLRVQAAFTPGHDARLALDATLTDPFAIVKGSALKPIDAKLELVGLDTQVLDALAGQGGLLAGLLGPDLRVTLDAKNASPSSGSVVVDATSATTSVHAAARFDPTGLHCEGNDGLEARVAPTAEFVANQTRRVLPTGTRIALAPDAGPLLVRVRNVTIPMPRDAAPNSATTPPPSALERLSQVTFDLEADVPSLVYADAATDAAQRPVTLTAVKLTSRFAPLTQPFASLAGTIVDDPAGVIAADVRALDPLTRLAEPGGVDGFRVHVDVRANRVPTAIVDVLARQDGLLVEALGGRVDLAFTAPDISISRGAFTVDMHSDLHGVKGDGHVEKGVIVVDRVDGLVATVGLGPVMSQRVVGKLVPTMVSVQKPAGAAPARFSVDALRFPLDGDLRKLDGTVRVDLGEVSYALFPKLAGFFQEPGASAAVKLPVLTVPIEHGVAGYQRLPVKIGSREYIFSGTYDIVTDAAQLTANVPVSALGKQISAELEKVRQYVDPAITVPLTIRGSLLDPSIGIDDKALFKVIEDAAGRALEKAGGDLLEDLFKKKKKD